SPLRLRAEVRYLLTHDNIDPRNARGLSAEVSGSRGPIPAAPSSGRISTWSSSRSSSVSITCSSPDLIDHSKGDGMRHRSPSLEALLMGVLLVAGCATSGPAFQPVAKLPKGTAVIYIYRTPEFSGDALSYEVKAPDGVVTILRSGG